MTFVSMFFEISQKCIVCLIKKARRNVNILVVIAAAMFTNHYNNIIHFQHKQWIFSFFPRQLVVHFWKKLVAVRSNVEKKVFCQTIQHLWVLDAQVHGQRSTPGALRAKFPRVLSSISVQNLPLSYRQKRV